MNSRSYRFYLFFLVVSIINLTGCRGRILNTPTPTPIPADLDWRDITLTDVITDQSFRISDFAGHVVIIDLMAVWCLNCLLQQQQIQLASASWEDDDVIVVSLDMEPTESEYILNKHATEYNITWRSAIPPQEMIDRLVAEFGPMATVVTATPLIILHADGTAEFSGRGLKPKLVILEVVESAR